MAQGGAISGTSDPTLSDTQRYGKNFSYIFQVPTGNYQVSLFFAETYSGDFAAKKRVFNVLANGITAISNLDIYATVGANTALNEVLANIAPSGGVITLQFKTTTGTDANAVVEAVQVIPQPPGSIAMPSSRVVSPAADLAGTPSPTPEPERGQTLLPSVVAVPNISRSGQPVDFRVQLTQAAQLNLTLYSILGEKVYRAAAAGNPGLNTMVWSLENSSGNPVASGLYFYLLVAEGTPGSFQQSGKVVVLH